MKYLSEQEIEALVEVVKTAEDYSTGEIRVHIDSSTEEEKAEVAFEVFQKLKMHETKDRNAVLFHINFHQRYLTIIGDEGIHKKVCQSFWDKIHDEITSEFAKGNYFKGLSEGILKTGVELKKYFPIEGENPNELPNEITFSQ
ncbi:MAG: TPM domain-containing protein [Flavobacteriaceae bacterium]|nr:TPM domain-containing protein [Flavobacteriaceae bacterium]